jgi:hypothetical protein
MTIQLIVGMMDRMRLDLLSTAARWRNLANTVPDENVRSLILREVKRLEEASRRQEQTSPNGTGRPKVAKPNKPLLLI